MPDEIPTITRGLFFGGSALVLSHPIGPKCVLTWFPDGDTEWLRLGVPKAGRGLDPAQARIYYRRPTERESAELRIVLPSDLPFRSSRQGQTERSISFDSDGFPVPELLLLYAIKSRLPDDRFSAIDELIRRDLYDFTEDFLGELVAAEVREDLFLSVTGKLMAKSALLPGGLKHWKLWEEVADKTLQRSLKQSEKESDKDRQRSHDDFLKSVRESALAFGGLPYQADVRSRWEGNPENQSDWNAVAKTLGFSWLPSKALWKSNWTKRSDGRWCHPAELR